MRKLRLLLALFVASICSVQGIRAEHVAPVFPSDQAKTLESGQTYYLYNPGSERFVYRNSGTVYAYTDSYSALTITNVESNIYTLQFEGSDYYLSTSGNDVKASSSTSSSYLNYRKYRIDATDGGYTMQRNYNYDATYFVGNATGNNNIYANFTSGNIVWQLYDMDGVNAIFRYRAKLALYEALVSAEDYSRSFGVEQYEALYNDENATNEELIAAAEAINNGLLWENMLASGESEYPIYTELIGSAVWHYSNNSYSYTTIVNGEGGLKAVVEVDQDATLIYEYHLPSSWSYFSFNVYLDGTHYQRIGNYEGYNGDAQYQRYFVELTAGRHTIEWKAKSNNESTATTFYLKGLAVYNTPTITVNVQTAGNLGTQVLNESVDHLKDVRKLKVSGNLNDDDWIRINMMTSLFELDLTNTTVTSLPIINPSDYLHKLKLPAGLTEIQESALENTRLEEIIFPATLISIGDKAFNKTRIKEAVLPEGVTTIGSYAFANNQSLERVYMPESVTSVGTYAFYKDNRLEEVTWSSQAKTIPNYCFDGGWMITTFNLPEGITRIGSYAFYDNYNCYYQLPSTLTSIGEYAFSGADKIESLYIPASCTIGCGAFANCSNLINVIIGEYVNFERSGSPSSYYTFSGCSKLEEIEFPTSFYTITAQNMLKNCTALKKVVFKSPTLILGNYYDSFFSNTSGTSIQVYVPSYLVSSYNQNPYWYDYNIMGFSTADVTHWNINNILTFNSGDRFEGTPDVNLQLNGEWTINGNDEQKIGNFYSWFDTKENNGDVDRVSKVISNCDNVSIQGSYRHGYYAYNKYRSGSNNYYGRWHFICLPFDMQVSDITTTDNARFAIRYYDGANRAENGTGGNWKDYASDAVIPAGTGFIIQCSKACRIYFYALDNASKQNVVSNRIFTKALDANVSEQSSNKGWNLVGNPWLCYYNIHKMNFTAPITTYNGYTRTYTAYSIIDDDYAIRPNEAFFVQCPDEITEISFPIDGRQFTTEITDQNGARAMQPSERKLIDVELSDGEMSDKTRFVLNPEAQLGYETSRDASKFLESGTSCPQLYTIEQGERLAINERPQGNGMVQLGIIVADDGTYTISAPRCQFKSIVLTDHETNTDTELADGGTYTFMANGGTDNSRFTLSLSGASVTSVQSVASSTQQTEPTYYNLNGQRIDAPQKGLYIVNGKKVMK